MDCRDNFAHDMRQSIDQAIADEVKLASPNGYKTKPYSRADWDGYWNSRIYAAAGIGPDSCDGRYEGPDGQEFIQYIITERRARKLPEINVEPRNAQSMRN
jgi:hypothetical protein